MAQSRRFVPVLVALLVLVGSLVPLPTTGGPVPSLAGVTLDRWLHVAGYASLTASIVWRYRLRWWPTVAATVALVVGYGGLLELLQGVVPTRTTSAADAVANTVGAAVAGGLWLVWNR